MCLIIDCQRFNNHPHTTMDVDEHHAPPVSIPTPLGNAHQVSTKYFMDEILPKLPPLPPFPPDPPIPPFPKNSANVDELIDTGALIQAVTGQGKLWGYTKKTPAGIHRKDVKQAFKWLQRGIHATVKAVLNGNPNPGTPLVFYNNKNGQSNIEQRTKDSLPDAFFLSHSAVVSSPAWSDIAVFGEYMINATPESTQQVRACSADYYRLCTKPSATQNIQKLSESLTNCMQMDPCRRFVFAFTAEDATMRLWYCDRMHMLVTEPFDFINVSAIIIHGTRA